MRSPPSLSPSQRAYTFQREKFLAGILERAARLYEDGYTVEAGERCHEFLITPPNTHLPYVVNALIETCTCCFYRRQVEGEPLTEEGALVACKHLHGLKALLRAECLRLQKQQRWCCYYRLRLQWIGVPTPAARRNRRHVNHGRRLRTRLLPLPLLPCVGTAPRRENSTHQGRKVSEVERRANTMNLDEVRDQIAKDNDGKWDTLLDANEMRFHNGRLIFPRLYRADHPNGLALTKWATAQVCHRLNMPIAYFRRCPAHLQDAQANHWLCLQQDEAANRNGSERHGKNGRNGHAGRDRWFLRAKNDVLRGALSERYTRLDNTDLLTSLLPSLDARFEVGWFALTDESLHLRLLDPTLARDVLPNDRLVAGLHIANSEVGKRSVTVDALVYRLVCANGLVRLVKGRSLLQRRHVAITPSRMELALKTALREALMQSTGFMERLSWATSQHVSDVPATLDTLAAEWGLSQTLRGKVQDAILTEPRHQHETLYGLVNGLTSAAQGLEADERYMLETLAGKLLETGPPRPQVKSLAIPAPIATLPALSNTQIAVGNDALEEELSLFAGEMLTLGRPIK